VYDRNNRLTERIDPAGHSTSQDYDDVGNIVKKTDGKGNTTEYSYDEFNRLLTVENMIGEQTDYAYDLNGNLLYMWDGFGNFTYYEYNAANLLIKRINDGGRTGEPGDYEYVSSKVESYTYTADGQMHEKTDRNGNTTHYDYDIHVRLLSQTVGALSIEYTYDNNGNILTNKVNGTDTTTRTYDAFNRTISKTVPIIGTSTYDYDITDDVPAHCTGERTTDPMDNVTLRVYDPVGRLSTVTANGMTSTYTYNDNGSLARVLYSDGSREDYTYTDDNLLETLTNRKGDMNNPIIDAYAYTYDAAHNLLSKTDSRGITYYTYDALNRLLTVTEPSGKVTSYTYDESGNRLTQTVVLGTDTTITTYSYNTLNRLTGTVTTLTDGNTLVTVTTEEVEYEYDFNGNQLLQTHTAYIDGVPQTPIVKLTNTYDLFNQLITTVTSDGVTVSNTYNGDGLRVGKSVNGTLTRYLYEYQRVVLEVNVNGDQIGRNVYGINLLTRQVGVDTFIYMYNGHADVTALLSTAGTIVATYYYDAFGNILDQNGVLSNNILYAGYQYDTETGLYYLNARMYDPVTARFMQEDTYTGDRNDPLSLNLYTYCHNEPLMYSDPTGHKAERDDEEIPWPSGMPSADYIKMAETEKGIREHPFVAPAWPSGMPSSDYNTMSSVAKTKHENDYDGDGVPNKDDATPFKENNDIVYIFYEQGGDSILKNEAYSRAKILRSDGIEVCVIGISDIDEFVKEWNNMGEETGYVGSMKYSTEKIEYDILEVVLVFHGSWQGLRIDEDEKGKKHRLITSPYCDPNTDISPSSLDKKEIGLLDLSSCNGGNVDHIGYNIASDFVVSQPEIDKVEAWDGSASYGIFGYDLNEWAPEVSKLSYDDQNESMAINGKYRVAQQQLTYSLDANNQVQVSDYQIETDYWYSAYRYLEVVNCHLGIM
jgi:RHS repeat-associated protein